MDVHLNALEIACVNRLAEMFEKGDRYVNANLADYDEDAPPAPLDPSDQFDVPSEQRAAILETMESMGLIADATHMEGVRFYTFRITSKAVQLARAIKEKQKQKEPEDIAEQLKQTARSNRYVAWIIIGFFVLTAAVTFANQSIQLLEKIGVMATDPKK